MARIDSKELARAIIVTLSRHSLDTFSPHYFYDYACEFIHAASAPHYTNEYSVEFEIAWLVERAYP